MNVIVNNIEGEHPDIKNRNKNDLQDTRLYSKF